MSGRTNKQLAIKLDEVKFILGNPDGVDEDQLQKAMDYIGDSDRPSYAAERLFPEQKKGTAYRAAVGLYSYCRSALAARDMRLRGNMTDAIAMEECMERIYENLPEFARW